MCKTSTQLNFLINKVQQMESKKQTAVSKAKEIHRHTRKKYSEAEKIHVVINSLPSEYSMAE